LPSRIRLVTIPSADHAFAARAQALLATLPSAISPVSAIEALQRSLQQEYPGAVVRPRDDLAEVGSAGEAVWYATHRAYRSRISASLVVPVRPEAAFRIYVERFAEWQTAVRLRPRELTPAYAGSEWVATWEFLGRRIEGTFRVVEADPPHSVRFEASGTGVTLWYHTSFTLSAGGTELRAVGDYDMPDGLLPRIADRLFVERSIQREIDAAHVALLALCRREVAESAAS
jgi:hypothetical protein